MYETENLLKILEGLLTVLPTTTPTAQETLSEAFLRLVHLLPTLPTETPAEETLPVAETVLQAPSEEEKKSSPDPIPVVAEPEPSPEPEPAPEPTPEKPPSYYGAALRWIKDNFECMSGYADKEYKGVTYLAKIIDLFFSDHVTSENLFKAANAHYGLSSSAVQLALINLMKGNPHHHLVPKPSKKDYVFADMNVFVNNCLEQFVEYATAK